LNKASNTDCRVLIATCSALTVVLRFRNTSQNRPATGYKRHSVHTKDHLLQTSPHELSGGILKISEFWACCGQSGSNPFLGLLVGGEWLTLKGGRGGQQHGWL